MKFAIRILLLCCLLYLTGPISTWGQQKSPLSYVPKSFGQQFEISTARRLRLIGEKPDGLDLNVGGLGSQTIQYGQFNFGSMASGQVAFVVVSEKSNENPQGNFRLFADLDRNRIIENHEEVEGDDDFRLFELPNVLEKDGRLTVRFRKSTTSNQSYSIQTTGGMTGTCEFEGEVVAVRRIDGNGNGLFSDPVDQIWLDLNNDGKWNSITERFPFQLALRLNHQRYAVRGDSEGGRFSLKPIAGEGILEVNLNLRNPEAHVEEFGMTLFGDDGASFRIKSLEKRKLPIGRYKVGSLSLLLKENDSRPWYFSFSHSGRDGEGDWFEIKESKSTLVDPLGSLEFGLAGDSAFTSGASVTVRPFLESETKLYLHESGRQKPDRFGEVDGNPATVTFLDSLGHFIGRSSSGFR